MNTEGLIPAERVAAAVFVIRGQRVLLDRDLATLYGVETKYLVRAVKRNADRFPADFAFQLTPEEWEALKCQTVTSKGRGGRRYAPHAFTEHGALMAASVLNSPAAVQVGLQVVRAFVRIRQLLATNEALARKVAALESQSADHEQGIRELSGALRQLLESASFPKPTRRIGFEDSSRDEPNAAKPRAAKPRGHSARSARA